jgi:CheY-like chemotaxis protein
MATVLVVDDEAAIRNSLRDALELDGHHVLVAGDGREALDNVAREPADLVILDLMMPVMDGWAFLEHFRGQVQFRTIPVLVISAYPNVPATVETYGVRVVRKPFDLEALLTTVADLTVADPANS